MTGRRRALTWVAGALLMSGARAQAASNSPVTGHRSPVTPFAKVVPGYRIQFPRDEGAHPDFRLEWWYLTGWLEDESRAPLGFQITFFRVRPALKHDNPSAFAPRQMLIAHAAISDPSRGSLIQAQRAARASHDLAGAGEGNVRVWIDDWTLHQNGGSYRARIPAGEFTLEMDFAATQAPMLQGNGGYSRKGPAPESASYYYSLPHLDAGGTLARAGRRTRVRGRAWLDHEWSSQYMDRDATGWDWIGINLDDGGALMAFRMRDGAGGQFWAGGSLRRPDGGVTAYAPGDIRFMPRREWRSARSGGRYPVALLVRIGGREFTIDPLFDDQEHDTRASTGAIYWEGAVRAAENGRPVGRGYLELTGYAKPLAL